MVRLLDVVVVLQQIRDAQHQRRVERRDETFVLADGRIVVGGDDDDVDIALRRTVGIVGHPVDEAGALARIPVRREHQIAIGVEFDRAVQLLAGITAEHQRIRGRRQPPAQETERIAIQIRVVGEQRRNRNDGGDVLVHIDDVAMRDRRGVADVVEPHRDGGAVDRAFIVADEVAEGRLAPEVGIRREDDRAVVGDFDVAMHRVAGALELNRETFDIAVVLEQLDDRDLDRVVFRAAQDRQGLVGIAVVAGIRQVVDRLIGQRGAGPGDTAVTVVDLIFEPGIAVEIGRRREQDGVVLEQHGVAAMAVADGGDRHRLAVVLDIVGEQPIGTDHDRIVLADRIAIVGRLEAIVVQLRRIIHGSDREADPACRGRPARVRDDVVEVSVAPEIGARGHMDQAIVADRDGDIGVGDHRLHREPVLVDIGVVGAERGRIEGEARAFGRRIDRIVMRDRRIVDRGDLDRHLGFGPAAFGRVRHVAEFGGAVEIGVRREGDVAVARQRDRPVDGLMDLADDHAVAVEVVGQEPLDADHQRTILGNGESRIRIGRCDRTHLEIDRGRGEAVMAVGNRIADRGGAVIAVGRGVVDVALAIDRGDAGIAGIDADDRQRIAIRVEIVAQQIGRLDDELDAGGDREETVTQGRRNTVAQQLPQRLLGPGHAVCEDVALDALGIGRKRIEHGEAVGAVSGEVDDDGIRSTIKLLDMRFRRGEVRDLDPVGAIGSGIDDRVVAGPASEQIEIVAGSAREQIVARPRGEGVVAVEAVDIVIAGAVDIRQRADPRRVAVPDRAVGETDRQAERRIVRRTEGVDQHHTIARAREREHEIVAVRAGADGRDDVCDVVVGQAQDVGALADRADPVVAVAAAIEIGIVAVTAVDQVVALAAHQRVGAVGADDDVVAVGGEAGEDRELHIGDGVLRAVGERDRLDPGGVDAERIDDDDLVGGPGKADRDIVAVGGDAVEADLGRGIAADLEPIGRGRGLVVDDVAAVAAGEAVGVVAGTTGQMIVAETADHDVAAGIAGQRVVGEARRARDQIGRSPHRAVGKADRLDAACAERALDGDARAGRLDDQREVGAILALRDGDVVRRDIRRQQQRVITGRVGDAVVAAMGCEPVGVVAGAAFEAIVSGAAVEVVSSAIADQPVIAGAAGQRIIEIVCANDVVAVRRGTGERDQGRRGPDRAIGEGDARDAHVRHRRRAEIDPITGADDFEHQIGGAAHDADIGRQDTGREAQRVDP